MIYLGLLALSGWAAIVPQPNATRLASIRAPYLVSCAANATWLVLWHYEQILPSVVVMLILLASIAVIYARLRATPALSRIESLCVDAPFSLYAGWITTASIANFATWRFEAGTYPFGLMMDEWALVSVALAISIYVGIGVLTRDPIYVGVFAWAALGIALQTLPTPDPVRVVAAAGSAVASALVLALLIERGWALRPAPGGIELRREGASR